MYFGIGYKIWRCATETGQYENYITSYDSKYACPVIIDNMVKPEETDEKICTFIRTFRILHQEESNEEQYYWLTLRQFQIEPIISVKVKKEFNYNIEIGKSYEFTFETTESTLDWDDQTIFEKAKLIKIEETGKVGLEQIQTNCQK